MGNRYADHVTPLYPQKLALTSPTGGGRSVGIVRSRTEATELVFLVSMLYYVVQPLEFLFLCSTKGTGCVDFNSTIGLSLIYRANISRGQLFFMPQLLNKSLPALRLTAARLHY